MQTVLIRGFSVVAYVLFLGVFVYFIAFVSGFAVPKTVDDGAATPGLAVAIDLALVFFFGVAHSVMARQRFKRAWTRVIPASAERSVYVLVASLQIALLCWQWRAIDLSLFRTQGAIAIVLRALQALGWALALLSSFSIDHFELFGLRQAFGKPAPAPTLRTPFLYRFVRHPLYLGMLIGLWITPVMTAGHFWLSISLTIYLLIGVHHEERDLRKTFGEAYRQYQDEVPMLLPLPRTRARPLAGGSIYK
jgi:protein-S-isoprenylcysteine O-methyltransferase Ste14